MATLLTVILSELVAGLTAYPRDLLPVHGLLFFSLQSLVISPRVSF